jgi:ornithine decarboxylase
VLTRTGALRAGAARLFTGFGPTCDSVDTLGVPFSLPSDIREGDWLHLRMMGAYSHILITNFNGLGLHETALVNDEN